MDLKTKKILRSNIRKILREELISQNRTHKDPDQLDIVAEVLSDNSKNFINELLGAGSDTSGEGDIYGGTKLSSLFTGFGDITKALKGGAAKIFQKGTTLFKTLLGAVGSTLVPTVNASYEKIFAQDRAAIKQIEGKYGTVYDRISTSLGSDAKVMAFFLSPGAYLTAAAARKAPSTVNSIINSLKDAFGIKEDKSYWMNSGYLLYEAEVDMKQLLSNVEKYADVLVAKLKPITQELVKNLEDSVKSIEEETNKFLKGDLGELKKQFEDPQFKEKLKAEIEKEAAAKKLSDADKEESLKVLDNIPKLVWPTVQGEILKMINTKKASLEKIDTSDSPESKAKIDEYIKKLAALQNKVKSSQGPA